MTPPTGPSRRRPLLPYLDHPGPIPLAHRGFSAAHPENSMAAFAAAVELGYRYVETDVHATRDGVLVAFHDETLDRVTDATGAVADRPWSEVRRARIDWTEPVPLLEDLLGTWPDLRVNIDVKADAAVEPLVEVIERTRAHDRVLVASFSDARRRAVVGRLSRPVATSGGTRATALFRLAAAARSRAGVRRALADAHCLQVPVRHGRVPVVTPATVALAHTAGVAVHVWTVNEAAEMRRLLDLGVDGLVTDRADVLRGVLLERGAWHGA